LGGRSGSGLEGLEGLAVVPGHPAIGVGCHGFGVAE